MGFLSTYGTQLFYPPTAAPGLRSINQDTDPHERTL
jgi:hypothetical protein